MHLRPDIHTALWIAAVTLVTIYVWRTLGGVLTANSSTETVGKAMASVI